MDVSGTLSSHANIPCGVPKGSILGPLLILIHVNDMSSAVSNKILLYADDSAILVADKCLSNIETVLQNELEIVSKWLVDNKLSLHLGKTESMLFGSRPRLKSQLVLSITWKGTIIKAKYCNYYYWGELIDKYKDINANSKTVFTDYAILKLVLYSPPYVSIILSIKGGRG